MTEIKHGKNTRERILDTIIEYIKKHGYSPSVREIGEMVNLKSSSTVHAHLKIMLDLGVIETDSEFSTPRAIRVPGYEFVKKEDSAWISCKDRLPEDGVDVLVWFEYFRYGEYNRLFQTAGISFTHNGEWSGFVNGSSGWNQLSILAWQPLPEPYKLKLGDNE